jgi:hypothetical protein
MVKRRPSDSARAVVADGKRVIPMTEQQGDRDAREDAAGIETGSAPQPLDFPGADSEPPGRPDGDPEPDEPTS